MDLPSDFGPIMAIQFEGSVYSLAPSVVVIGIGPLSFLLLALRHGAPASPRIAGAVAGLLAGGIAATIYALHYTDSSPLFAAVWYGRRSRALPLLAPQRRHGSHSGDPAQMPSRRAFRARAPSSGPRRCRFYSARPVTMWHSTLPMWQAEYRRPIFAAWST